MQAVCICGYSIDLNVLYDQETLKKYFLDIVDLPVREGSQIQFLCKLCLKDKRDLILVIISGIQSLLFFPSLLVFR